MAILFLHGLESSTAGKKARYLQEKYPSQIRVPDLQISWWRPTRTNSVLRSALRLACKRPVLPVTNWNKFLQAAALDSLTQCSNVAVNEIRRAGDQPPRLVIGSSWGGAVALCLLARGDWQGPTLLLAPALKRLFFRYGSNQDGSTRQQLDSWYKAIKSNLAAVGQKNKTVVVHGDRDATIPLEDSQELCAAIDAELIVVPGGDHRLNEYLLHQNKLQGLTDRLLHLAIPGSL